MFGVGQTHLVLHFDGSCTKNPGGEMGFGWHVDTADGVRVADESGPVHGYPEPERSCNTAEFEALLAGLEWVSAFRLVEIDRLDIRGDSQLVVKIVNGEWNAKKPHLKVLADRCKRQLRDIDAGHIDLSWIPREQNDAADRLSANRC